MGLRLTTHACSEQAELVKSKGTQQIAEITRFGFSSDAAVCILTKRDRGPTAKVLYHSEKVAWLLMAQHG